MTSSKGTRAKPKGDKAAAGARKVVQSPAHEKALEDFGGAMKVFQKRDYARARDLFRSVVEKYREEAEICDRARGLEMVCERQIHTEGPVLERAEELCTRGVIHLNEGEIEEALELFQKAADNGGGGQALYLLACAMTRAGRGEEGLAALRRSVESDPSNRSRAANEKDFERLRDNPAFDEILGRASGRAD